MVYNKGNSAKASPKVKRLGTNLTAKKTTVARTHLPSTSGSTTNLRSEEDQRSIKVIVRVRPHNERELQDNYRTVIKVIDGKMLIFDPKEEEDPFFFKGVAQKGNITFFSKILILNCLVMLKIGFCGPASNNAIKLSCKNPVNRTATIFR